MKIIFCGPPHSGKTVLIDCLRKLLPSDGSYTFRVHRDGEGAWSNNPNQEMTQLIREKGDYDEAFINRKCEELQKYNSFPIVLVDIGGMLQDDKIPIFEACDAFVIVSNDGEMSKKWLAFGSEHNCRCIADLYSVEHGEDEIFGFKPYLTGRVANLIRGTNPKQDIITALADVIVKESDYVPDYQLAPGVIDFNKVAVDLGMINSRTTRFQQTVYFADYKEETAQSVYHYLQEHYPVGSDSIYGARAVWLSAMAACMYYRENGNLRVYDMNTLKYIPIHPLAKSSSPDSDIINYKVIESDYTVFIDIHITKTFFSDTEDYPRCVLPHISSGKELFISGKLPLWLLDAIMLSYDAPAKYVFQPGKNSPWICCYADDKSKIGMCLDHNPSEEVDEYFAIIKEEKDRQEYEKKIKKQMPNAVSENEIERTYLIKEPQTVRSLGKFKHYVHHIFIQTTDGILRMSDRYKNDNEDHQYKITVKKDISAEQRIETNNALTREEYENKLQANQNNIVGDVVTEVFDMPDGSTGMIRKYANGTVIVTGEIEYPTAEDAAAFTMPEWGIKEVTDDPSYRGQAMAIANYKK